jgi:hypothetical protein
MEYIIIDDNQDFAEAFCEQLCKNKESSHCNSSKLSEVNNENTEAIDYKKHSEEQIADAIIETYGSSKCILNKNRLPDEIVIFINLNLVLNNCERQKQKGIELLTWLRIKGVMNHVVLYSFESLETILKKEERNLILTSRGTSFVRLPSDFKEFSDSKTLHLADKKNIQWILKEAYIAGLKHNGQNKFHLDNIWIPIIENTNEIKKSLETEVGKFLIDQNETITIEVIKKLKNDILSYNIQGLKINIVLCDDHAEQKIEKTVYNKKEIIIKNFGLKYLDVNFFDISTCTNLKGLYNQPDCDIILLDYKLGSDEKGKEKTGTQYFIARLEESKKEKHQFLGKNWVLPISYLSSEMIEDFREKNVAFTENDLVLSLGADPISQPYRFLYELLYILNEQLKRAIGWTIEDNFMEYLKKANDLIEFIKGCKEINREGTKNLFSEVSTLFHRIHTIKNNKREGLYQSLNNKIKDEEKKIEILSLYRDLLYQLSFMKHEDNELLFFLLTDLEDCLKNYSQKNC